MILTSEYPCDVCGAEAVVVLSDAEKRPPIAVNGQLFARHKPIERHAFCKRHLRPPRIYGPDGKLVEEVVVS